ncbi:MAG: hypothetical protein ABI472_19085 [Ginsengibacter sp.]
MNQQLFLKKPVSLLVGIGALQFGQARLYKLEKRVKSIDYDDSRSYR